MRKLISKTISFILMLVVMFWVTLTVFRLDWPILGWVVGIFFIFTLIVFPYKSYFKTK